MFLAEQREFKNLPERAELAIPAKNAFPPADPKGKAGFDFESLMDQFDKCCLMATRDAVWSRVVVDFLQWFERNGVKVR